MAVYLDYNSTTPMDPAVLAAMMPFLTENYGNAGSIHSAGQRARSAVDSARESVARMIGAKAREIVFTSGGTEADNLALFGVVGASHRLKKHIVTTSIEHSAVLNACQELQKRAGPGAPEVPDVEVTYVPVGRSGVVDPEDIRRALRTDTILISVMHANNELGTVQPIQEIARIAAEGEIYFHCDAVQSAGKIPVNVDRLGVDLLSVSAHKIYGPKGVGALYVRSDTPLSPQLRGGQAERGRRAGTENVAGIVGFGKAARLAEERFAEDQSRIGALRDRFESALIERIPDVLVNGAREHRVANTTNLTFAGAGGEALVIALDLMGVECSTGAACSSGTTEPSHVLLAIGLSRDDARSSLRFSLGRSTTDAEIDHALSVIPRAVERLRALSPHSVNAVSTR